MTAQTPGLRVLPLLTAWAVTGLLSVSTLPAAAAQMDDHEPPPEPEGGVSQGDLDASIHVWDVTDNIIDLGQNEDEDDVVVLETDLLFASNAWELTNRASARITELIEEIAEGASVEVQGHTDSRPVDEARYGFDNQELSENRAQAVAEVLEEGRSDLSLDVEGFGASEPAVTEDPDDPSTYADNRRVEIRYS
ncbi:OmpA family protein [Nesterenkonia sp. HG001]|uniref:OmpA family protein n=1 Tax=Nesterenkonia sp. HG001 TaxID=2983207 RepID=UPI002AC43AA6|nr:OmpA family protein [Nesterenkonia sp. HG001]MDZ5078814.1 OmpA family protein [Nesterenkonia sp. HG001]